MRRYGLLSIDVLRGRVLPLGKDKSDRNEGSSFLFLQELTNEFFGLENPVFHCAHRNFFYFGYFIVTEFVNMSPYEQLSEMGGGVYPWLSRSSLSIQPTRIGCRSNAHPRGFRMRACRSLVYPFDRWKKYRSFFCARNL